MGYLIAQTPIQTVDIWTNSDTLTERKNTQICGLEISTFGLDSKTNFLNTQTES